MGGNVVLSDPGWGGSDTGYFQPSLPGGYPKHLAYYFASADRTVAPGLTMELIRESRVAENKGHLSIILHRSFVPCGFGMGIIVSLTEHQPCRGTALCRRGDQKGNSVENAIGQAVAFAMGVLTVSIGLWYEWIWRRRLWHCVWLMGRVVDEVPGEHDHLSTRLKIEYEHDGVTRQFIAGYGGQSLLKIGSAAHVVLDLQRQQAEHYTWANRWLFTVCGLLLGAFCIWAAFD